MKRRYPVTFIISAIMLVASCIISAMMLYNYDRAKFAVAIIPTAVFAVIFFIDLALAEKNSLKFIAKLNEAVGTAENDALYYFETPSVIVDSDFRVLWCNKEFNDQIIPEYDIFGTEIYKAVDIDIKALMLEGRQRCFRRQIL